MLKDAVACIQQAIEWEEKGDFQQALLSYRQGLDRFDVILKYEKNETTKKILTERMIGYLERAEHLKEFLSTPKAVKAEPEETDDKPSVDQTIISEKPNVKWGEVAGLQKAKDSLYEAAILPLKFPGFFTGKRKPWTGILLYGPPGTGKSYLAKALATECDSMFFSVSSSDLISKWQGESERTIRALFEKARGNAPSIIFIDEVDSMCGSRDSGGDNESSRRIKTEFLTQMQGVGRDSSKVLVLGATNTPWSLDPAIRRRFEKRIYIPLPDAPARRRLFELSVGDTPHMLSDEHFRQLAVRSDGMSGSDISVCVREALMAPIRICQQAKFFIEFPAGTFSPAENYPPCAHCPMELSGKSTKGHTCKSCGYVRKSLLDISQDQIAVPLVQFKDFKPDQFVCSVTSDELIHFDKWTREFGLDGSQ